MLGQPRGTQRYQPIEQRDEGQLTEAIIALASEYGRYRYRRVTVMLRTLAGRWARTGCNGSGGGKG